MPHTLLQARCNVTGPGDLQQMAGRGHVKSLALEGVMGSQSSLEGGTVCCFAIPAHLPCRRTAEHRHGQKGMPTLMDFRMWMRRMGAVLHNTITSRPSRLDHGDVDVT